MIINLFNSFDNMIVKIDGINYLHMPCIITSSTVSYIRAYVYIPLLLLQYLEKRINIDFTKISSYVIVLNSHNNINIISNSLIEVEVNQNEFHIVIDKKISIETLETMRVYLDGHKLTVTSKSKYTSSRLVYNKSYVKKLMKDSVFVVVEDETYYILK